VIEWPPNDEQVMKSLPGRMSHKRLVRIIKERCRTERMYEDLKGELGLDHFEGRSFVGWHHHVSVALCCYAFVVAERRPFSPLDPKAKCRRRARDRGLSGTSPTLSSRHVSRLRVLW
jgi:SRSO17 transposase